MLLVGSVFLDVMLDSINYFFFTASVICNYIGSAPRLFFIDAFINGTLKAVIGGATS